MPFTWPSPGTTRVGRWELPKPDDVEAEYSVVNDENATPTATQPDNEDDDARVIN